VIAWIALIVVISVLAFVAQRASPRNTYAHLLLQSDEIAAERVAAALAR
jgi:hypothetical protein